MPAHRLDPLLHPQSIAVVGASERAGSVGLETLLNLRKGAYPGTIYPINPSRDTVAGIPCFASLVVLPEVPQLVVFAVNDQRLEAALDEAIARGVQAAVIFSALSHAGLSERIRDKANAAGMLLHGGNCMGFHNFAGAVRVSGFDTRVQENPGSVVLLSQSGAGMSGILDCEERLDFLFAASTGQELCLGIEDYLDYVLDLPQTRVVGLFLETSRQPRKLIAALDKAVQRRIPVVAIKVGKTDLASRLAVSHSGALSGSDAVFDAVFDRYGVQRVEDMAQLAAALMLFAQVDVASLPSGGLASLHDSGGERQLAIDVAAAVGVTYPALADATVKRLARLLDEGLPAVNPLDAWGSGGEAGVQTMQDSFCALMADPGIALGAVVHDRAPGGDIYPQYVAYLRAARAATGKPVCLVANHAGSGGGELALAAVAEGFAVIDGLREFQVAARCVLAYRDFQARERLCLQALPPTEKVEAWARRLRAHPQPSETVAGQLLREFGIAVVTGLEFDGPDLPAELIASLQFPVVLKTAAPAVAHKSDVNGVVLNLGDAPALDKACREMASRLGPRLMVAPMVGGEGVEMIMGVSRDSQFGPVVVLGMGGIYAELLRDTITLLPPFSADDARRAVGQLKFSAVLDAVRGRPALAVDTFCEMASRLSLLALSLPECVQEIDINPVKLTVDNCIGLDALLVLSAPEQQ